MTKRISRGDEWQMAEFEPATLPFIGTEASRIDPRGRDPPGRQARLSSRLQLPTHARQRRTRWSQALISDAHARLVLRNMVLFSAPASTFGVMAITAAAGGPRAPDGKMCVMK